MLCLVICLGGCVRDSYTYGISKKELLPKLPVTPNQIQFGGHHPRIDKIEKVVSYPKVALARWVPEFAPKPPAEVEEARMRTIQTASDYLDANGIKGLNIDVREYSPSQQWARLRANERIAPFWKYTGGTVNHAIYCVMPRRAFGFDYYDAYTNTLSINSTSPSRAIFQAGFAKDNYDRHYPGTYMALNHLPVVPLVRDVRIASDVLTYSHIRGDWETEKNLYPEMYGQLGGDTVSQATSLIPEMAFMPFYTVPILTGVGAIAGTATGKAMARYEEKRLAQQVPPQTLTR